MSATPTSTTQPVSQPPNCDHSERDRAFGEGFAAGHLAGMAVGYRAGFEDGSKQVDFRTFDLT